MVFDGFAFATNGQGYDLHKVLRDATPYEVQIIQLSLIYQSHQFFYLIKNKGVARLKKRNTCLAFGVRSGTKLTLTFRSPHVLSKPFV